MLCVPSGAVSPPLLPYSPSQGVCSPQSSGSMQSQGASGELQVRAGVWEGWGKQGALWSLCEHHSVFWGGGQGGDGVPHCHPVVTYLLLICAAPHLQGEERWGLST